MRNNINFGLLSIVLALMAGCGSSNNDQGVSFTLSQFNAIDESGEVQCDEFTQGTQVALADFSDAGGISLNQYLGVSFVNNIVGQSIRVERVLIDYFVPGSSQNPPSTTWPVGQILPPETNGSNNGFGPPDTSFPDFTGEAPECSYFAVMPPSILAWLDQNRNLLPELPYTVEARVKALGVTSSGQVLYTNSLSAYVVITNDTTVPGTEPDDTTTGTTETGGSSTGSEDAGVGDGAGDEGGSDGTNTDGSDIPVP